MIRGFVLVHDTLCYGVIPAERDGENRVVLYATFAAAEAERIDAAECRADSSRDENEALEDDGDVFWVEPAHLLADGSLFLPEQHLIFSERELRRLIA